jgi:hypothetical protein
MLVLITPEAELVRDATKEEKVKWIIFSCLVVAIILSAATRDLTQPIARIEIGEKYRLIKIISTAYTVIAYEENGEVKMDVCPISLFFDKHLSPSDEGKIFNGTFIKNKKSAIRRRLILS